VLLALEERRFGKLLQSPLVLKLPKMKSLDHMDKKVMYGEICRFWAFGAACGE